MSDDEPRVLRIEVLPPVSDGVWRVLGTAATTYDLVDVLPWAETVAVLNIGQNSWMDDGLHSLPPREIAEAQGVPAVAHDMSWTWNPGMPPNDLLVLAHKDLRKFFQEWSVDIVDWDGELTEPDAEQLALAVNTHEHDLALLPMLPRSGTHYRSHDDCYLTVESRDRTAPERILALYAASALGIEDGGTITEPPRALARSPCWTGWIKEAGQYGVRIGLAPQGWRLGAAMPGEFPVLVSLDRVTGTWNGAGG